MKRAVAEVQDAAADLEARADGIHAPSDLLDGSGFAEDGDVLGDGGHGLAKAFGEFGNHERLVFAEFGEDFPAKRAADSAGEPLDG